MQDSTFRRNNQPFKLGNNEPKSRFLGKDLRACRNLKKRILNGKYNFTSENADTVVGYIKRKVACNTHEETYQLYLALPGLVCNTGPVWGTILEETKQHMRAKGSRDRRGAVREMPFWGGGHP